MKKKTKFVIAGAALVGYHFWKGSQAAEVSRKCRRSTYDLSRARGMSEPESLQRAADYCSDYDSHTLMAPEGS